MKGTKGAKIIDELKPHESLTISYQRGHIALLTALGWTGH
jgi:hypothetical protein